MGRKTKFKVIPYHIYPYNVIVSFHNSYKELEKLLKRVLPKNMHKEIDMKGNHNARTIMFSGGLTCIWFKKPETFSEGQVAHEALHAVQFLLERLDTPLDRSTSEAYAYCLHYLVNEIMKFRKKFIIKPK
jgi:hypothetical protein